MKQPLVSVIIPNYNYAHYLPETLDSVLAQTYPGVEIIVVDDGSRDDSTTVIRSYGDRVRLIEQKNQGVSAARNRGVQESSGELVAFLDADDVWLPKKLELQVQQILDHPKVGLVHCGLAQEDSAGKSLGILLDGMEGSVSKDMLLFNRTVILGAGSTSLLPRATFVAIGGFDTRLSTSADWDFCYRVALSHPVAFVPEALVRYRVHGANMHSSIKLMEQDMLLGYAKAFGTNDVGLIALRDQCYGNLHLVLAGCYFRAGERYDFVRHALKSLWLRPSNLKRLLEFPLRRFRNKGAVA